MSKPLLTFAILFIVLSCNKSIETTRENAMYFVHKSLDGIPCNVYFFKRWGTYEHPVTPIDPISYAEALQRSGYCRAWMCKSDSSEQFLLFEAMRNNLELTSIKKKHVEINEPEFFSYQNDKPGPKISAEVTLDRDRFLASLPGSDDNLSLIDTSLGYRFRYYYKPGGQLEKVEITDMTGEIKILDY